MRQLPRFSAQSEENYRIEIIIKDLTKQILNLGFSFNNIDKIVVSYITGKRELTVDEIGMSINTIGKLIPSNDIIFSVGTNEEFKDNLLNISVIILYKPINNQELFDFYNQLIITSDENYLTLTLEDIFSREQLNIINEFTNKTKVDSVILSENNRIAVSEVNKRLIIDIAKTPELVYKLTSRQFEELVAELFMQEGYDVELT